MAYNITGIVEPTTLSTTGPTWANNLNTSTTAIDNHDHTSGKGLRITPSAININADLSYTGFGPIGMAYATLALGGGVTPTSKALSILTDNAGNLWWQNNAGGQVQLTSGNSVQSNGTGTFTGIYQGGGTGYTGSPAGTGNAAVAYDQLSSQYVFHTDATHNATGNYLSPAALVGAKYITVGGAGRNLIMSTTNTGTTFKGGVSVITSTGAGGYGWELDSDVGVGAVDGSYPAALYSVQPTAYSNTTQPAFTTVFGGMGATSLTKWTETNWGGQVFVSHTQDLSQSHQAHSYFLWRAYSASAAAGSPATADNSSSYDISFSASYGAYNAGTTGTMARFTPYWAAAAGAKGGFRIQLGHGSYAAPTWNSTGGVIDMNENGGPGGGVGIGLGGGATTSGLVAVYGNLSPSTGGSYDLGINGTRWRTLYCSTVSADTNITATSTIVSSSYLQGTTLRPTDAANNSGQNIYNRTSFISNFAVVNTGVSPGNLIQQSNVTSTGNWAAGVLTVTFPWTLSTNAAAIAYCADGTGIKITGGGAGTGTITVTTADAASHTFTLIVIGG